MPFDLRVTNDAGEEIVPFVARHTLSLERLLFAIAGQHHDKDGLILPPAVAPYSVIVTPVFYADEAQKQAAAQICGAVEDALLDDRDERPGVKFKDADLIGIPNRINIGKKLAKGLVEVVDRATKQVTDVPVAQSVPVIVKSLFHA
jgi:prolyl-tRNA synthetase